VSIKSQSHRSTRTPVWPNKVSASPSIALAGSKLSLRDLAEAYRPKCSRSLEDIFAIVSQIKQERSRQKKTAVLCFA
jgi:hypothetical protein